MGAGPAKSQKFHLEIPHAQHEPSALHLQGTEFTFNVAFTLPKFHIGPWKVTGPQIGTDRLPTTIFQGHALKLRVWKHFKLFKHQTEALGSFLSEMLRFLFLVGLWRASGTWLDQWIPHHLSCQAYGHTSVDYIYLLADKGSCLESWKTLQNQDTSCCFGRRERRNYKLGISTVDYTSLKNYTYAFCRWCDL